MSRIRVVQVVTRLVRGGAREVLLRILERLPREEFEPELVCGPEDDGFLRELAARGVRTTRLASLVRDLRPFKDGAALIGLWMHFRSRAPHVVHAHTYKAGMLASVAGRLAGVPAVVCTPHGHIFAPGARIPGVPLPGRRLGLLRRLTRAAQSLAHRVTLLSDEDLRDQLALGLAVRSRCVVIPNGVDPSRFEGGGPRLFSGRPVIGAVGRFSAEKGHDVLLEAFGRLRPRLPEARLVLTGFGEREAELRSRAAAFGGAVEFTGERDSAEVLPSFDIFVQPSVYESQGLAILEAMAAGRPVVATDVGGVRATVRNGETGLLVPPDDPDALSRAVLRLAQDPRLAQDLAGRARDRVRERFSADRMAGSYERLYRDLLGRYNPRPCTTT